MDLGKAWWDWTEKPFVFAVWAVGSQSKASPADLENFRESCLAGIARRGDLAEGEEEREYLTKCIQYGLGKEEKEGMMEFAKRSGIREVRVEWV
jgi:predicted solute-binding protein